MNRWFSIFYARKLRDPRYMGRMGLILAYLLLMTLMLPKSYRLEYRYDIGEFWDEPDLYAPFEFAIHKSPDSILAEQNRRVAQVWDIYAKDSITRRNSLESIQNQIEQLNSLIQRYQKINQPGTPSVQDPNLNQQLFSGRYPDLTAQMVLDMNPSWESRSTTFALNLADSIYNRGYLSLVRPDSTGPFISLRKTPSLEEVVPVSRLLTSREDLVTWIDKHLTLLPQPDRMIIRQILLEEIKPNYAYSEALTRAEQKRVRALVSPVYGKIFPNQRIIQRGERVDRDTDVVIRSLMLEKEIRYGGNKPWNVFWGQFLVIFLITSLLLLYLSVNRPRLYFSLKHLSLILTIFILAVGAMALSIKLTNLAVRVTDTLGQELYLSYIYLAPVCIVPIFITNFFGHRTGFLCNLLAALYGAVLVERGLEFAFVQIFAGTVAVYSLHRLRKREVFFYTLGYILLGYVISYLVFNFYSKGGFVNINYSNLLLFGINVVLTVIVYNLIYVFERIFGITSDLTYLELLDTNHPLLQRMARKAPGTFQHSLQVANIAEATINVVGGNALLTHVGALYHDIGKIENQKYFIENIPEEGNPHDDLSCESSADMIISHVRLGVEMAQKYKLPKEIISFIRTHHGTTRVEYFYRKHLKEIKCEPPHDEEHYRYPGPKPFSKETAVLMISDSVEAASRSLKKPTGKDIKKLVNRIIDHKIRDNQLENSNLTFKDITAIRRVVTKQLLSIYHTRIEYPKEQEPESPAVTGSVAAQD